LASAPRILAHKTLLAAEKDSSSYINDLLYVALNRSTLSPPEKRWTTELVYGTTRMKLQLDALIRTAFKGRYKKTQHAVKVLLRMGTFQLKYMQTADHAAIHETVDLCKRVKQPGAANLVNAILRQMQILQLDTILEAIDDPLERLSVETSHPKWMLQKWLSRYTESEVAALCEHNNSVPKTWIRRNTLLVDQSEFEGFLHSNSIRFASSTLLENFYEVDGGGLLLNSNEFRQGWFSFQDLAAGLIPHILDPQTDDIIVDACAAPGGKMSMLYELTGGQADIIAIDASSSRLEKVSETIRRLGLKGISVQHLDAASQRLPDANRILLDVPCSGTGVLNRRPDARWKHQVTDEASLVGIQSRIFQNCWKSLRAGGHLVYATCTLEPEENWDLVDSVLRILDNAEIDSISDEKLKPYIDERGALATLPWIHGMDGMFAVKIRKSL